MKAVTTSFQSFDADKKRFVVERLGDVSLSVESRASALLPPQEILQMADGDSMPSLQEQEPVALPLHNSSHTPPYDVPVCIEHFLPLTLRSDRSCPLGTYYRRPTILYRSNPSDFQIFISKLQSKRC